MIYLLRCVKWCRWLCKCVVNDMMVAHICMADQYFPNIFSLFSFFFHSLKVFFLKLALQCFLLTCAIITFLDPLYSLTHINLCRTLQLYHFIDDGCIVCTN